MIIRHLICIILCFVCTFSTTSCSEDSDNNEEQVVKEHDWLLEGRWDLNEKNPELSFTASVIQFNNDGSGAIDDKIITWYTYNGVLFIHTDDGMDINGSYRISGATLNIDGIGKYTCDLPIVGTWYADDIMKEFEGNTFCYYFDKNGEGIRYTFDYIGLSVKTNFKWNRRHGGVSIKYHNATEDKTCRFSEDMMHIEGEGTFTSALPFYGKWKSVDCEKGLISEYDDNYSTLEITAKDKKNTFICHYRIKQGEEVHDAMFQGDLKIITSHQQTFNDQKLFIIKDVTGGKDAQALEYRFFYYPPWKNVYLDLSIDFKTRKFVRYELI